MMDFDFNELVEHILPPDFQSMFDNDIFEWNIEVNQPHDVQKLASSSKQHDNLSNDFSNIDESHDA